jgi:Rps23 Pro-64 3,4-dihydroxylase Tpa1-like proline 4-hydroxylase
VTPYTFDEPFPHIVIDDYIDQRSIRRLHDEWPTVMHSKEGSTSKKRSQERLGPEATRVFQNLDVQRIEQMTGVTGLFRDADNFGGGYHEIPPGGFLNMHIDFNMHPQGWHRRINFLLYLNNIWSIRWNGQLSLGRNQEKKIDPIAGRAVIFETTEHSWHGHPEPLKCPNNMTRRSLAFYMYTHTLPDADPHTTVYA